MRPLPCAAPQCLRPALITLGPTGLHSGLELYVIPGLSAGTANSVIMIAWIYSDCLLGNKIYIPVREQAAPVGHRLVKPATH